MIRTARAGARLIRVALILDKTAEEPLEQLYGSGTDLFGAEIDDALAQSMTADKTSQLGHSR